MSELKTKVQNNWCKPEEGINETNPLVAPGHRGFLATYRYSKENSVREAFELLNYFAGKLYGLEKKPVANDLSGADEEKENLPNTSQKGTTKFRFIAYNTGVPLIIFIGTTLPDPHELGTYIVKEFAHTQWKPRYLYRLMPIDIVCSAKIADIIKASDILFDKYFMEKSCGFEIIFKKSCNNSVCRADTVTQLAELVFSKNNESLVDFKHPQKSIIVNIMKRVCCLSVVEGYNELKKYNLFELSKANEEKKADNTVDKVAAATVLTEGKGEEITAVSMNPMPEATKAKSIKPKGAVISTRLMNIMQENNKAKLIKPKGYQTTNVSMKPMPEVTKGERIKPKGAEITTVTEAELTEGKGAEITTVLMNPMPEVTKAELIKPLEAVPSTRLMNIMQENNKGKLIKQKGVEITTVSMNPVPEVTKAETTEGKGTEITTVLMNPMPEVTKAELIKPLEAVPSTRLMNIMQENNKGKLIKQKGTEITTVLMNPMLEVTEVELPEGKGAEITTVLMKKMHEVTKPEPAEGKGAEITTESLNQMQKVTKAADTKQKGPEVTTVLMDMDIDGLIRLLSDQ